MCGLFNQCPGVEDVKDVYKRQISGGGGKMKQKYVIALYIRLSVEDFKTESLSIPNQKLLLLEKAMSLQEWDNSEVCLLYTSRCV